MPIRLAPWRRPRPEQERQTLEADRSEPSAGSDRFLTLIPEGGFTFRLLAFDAVESAQAYVQAHASLLSSDEIVAFWALDSESDRHSDAAPSEPREVVVIVRKPDRRDVVNIHSFLDIEAARTFLRDSAVSGLDLGLVLLYWAARVSIHEYAKPPQHIPTRRPSREHASQQLGPVADTPVGRREVHIEDRPAQLGDQQSTHRGNGSDVWVAATQDAADLPVDDGTGHPHAPRFLQRIHAWRGWDGLAALMVAASTFKFEVYHDLKRDPAATGRATLIVVLGAVAAAIGASGSGLPSVAWHATAGPAGWAAYVGAVWIIGRMIGDTRQPLLRLYQAAGLASSPALLYVLGVVPVYGMIFVLAASLWIAAAMAVASRVVLELTRESTIVVAAIGWCLYFGISQAAPLFFVS